MNLSISEQYFSSYNLSSDFTPKLPFYAAQEQISHMLPPCSSGTAGATPTSECAASTTATTHCIHILVYARHFFDIIHKAVEPGNKDRVQSIL
jgi:hypothetical protein